MAKLTKHYVDSLKGRDKPYTVSDGSIPNFYVRVLPTSKKSYYFQYRPKNRPKSLKTDVKKRLFLGHHGIITLEQARKKAKAVDAKVAEGSDPLKEKIEKRLEPLVRDIAQRFINEHVKIHCKAGTQREYLRHLNKKIIPSLGDIKISELGYSDVASLHQSLYSTPYDANRCLEVLSKLCNLTEKWGLRNKHSNPCEDIETFSEKARDRSLNKEETMRLAKALDELKQYSSHDMAAIYCIKLLIFTGCRLGEIRTLKWEYVNYEKKVILLPDSKTGAKTICGGNDVMNILEEIKRDPSRPKNNPYVIWGKKPESCLADMQKPWRRFCKLASLDNVRIHDLRHNFASLMTNDGTSLAMVGKVLGHSQVQTTERYSHINVEPLIEAVERVTHGLAKVFNVKSNSSSQAPTEENSKSTDIQDMITKAPVYLNTDQAAQYLGVTTRFMENLRWRKIGPPFIKFGNRNEVRYRLEAIKEFIQ